MSASIGGIQDDNALIRRQSGEVDVATTDETETMRNHALEQSGADVDLATNPADEFHHIGVVGQDLADAEDGPPGRRVRLGDDVFHDGAADVRLEIKHCRQCGDEESKDEKGRHYAYLRKLKNVLVTIPTWN